MSSIERGAGDEIPLLGPVEQGPVGIRGWLLFLACWQALGTFALPVMLAYRYRHPEAIEVFRQFPLASYGELALNLARFALAFVALVLLFRKSRYFPRLFVLLAVTSVLLPLLEIAWAALVLSIQLGTPVSEVIEIEQQDIRQFVLSLIGAVIWITYVLRSKRVRNTFILGLSARDPEGAPRLETPLLMVIGAIILSLAVGSIVLGVEITIRRGVFNFSIVGGALQAGLALWLLRGSEVARLLLCLLFGLGTVSFAWIAFSYGQSPSAAAFQLAAAEFSAVIFWFLAFSKRLRAELEINEAKYAKPASETAGES